MVSLDVIEQEIMELEARGETTYAICERLAWLYVCRDHLKPLKAGETTGELHGSEFLELSSGVPFDALMKIMDEHMDAMKLLYPREYDSIITKIRGLA